MVAKVLLVLALYLFAMVWVVTTTEEELREMRNAVRINADQFQPQVIYVDPGREEEND